MKIYTDGSAHPNPGPGGFGVIVCDMNDNILEAHSHYEDNTTNNIQELKAILYAMINYGIPKEWTSFQTIPIVYSDSAYAINTLTNWMFSWERNGWKKSDGKVPENLEIIQNYFELYKSGYRIDLQKVSGHSGIKGNELADRLATGKISVKDIETNFYK